MVITVPKNWALFCGFLLVLCDLRGEGLEKELHLVRQNMKTVKENQNGQWFAFRSQITIPEGRLTKESAGLFFRERDFFYAVYKRYEQTEAQGRELVTYVEAIISTGVIVFRDHLLSQEKVVFAQTSHPSSASLMFEVESSADIHKLFESRVQNLVSGEFAIPRLDSTGKFTVSYRPRQTFHRAKTDLPVADKMFTVSFFKDKWFPLLPGYVEMTRRDLTPVAQIGFVKLHYGRGIKGPFLTELWSEGKANHESDPVEVKHIKIREVESPAWIPDATPPHMVCSSACQFLDLTNSLKFSQVSGEIRPFVEVVETSSEESVSSGHSAAIDRIEKTLSLKNRDIAGPHVEHAELFGDDRFHTSLVPWILLLISASVAIVWIVLWLRIQRR